MLLITFEQFVKVAGTLDTAGNVGLNEGAEANFTNPKYFSFSPDSFNLKR